MKLSQIPLIVGHIRNVVKPMNAGAISTIARSRSFLLLAPFRLGAVSLGLFITYLRWYE